MFFSVSFLFELLSAVFIFGPHSLFSFAYIQEFCLVLISVYSLLFYRLRLNTIAVLGLSFIFIVKSFQSFLYQNFDPLLLGSIIRIVFLYITCSFIVKLRILHPARALFFAWSSAAINYLIIDLQIFYPSLRIIMRPSNPVDEDLIVRFFGWAKDGFQITTILSLITVVLVFKNRYLFLRFFTSIVKNYYLACGLTIAGSLIIIVGWTFQGRSAQAISLLSIILIFSSSLFRFGYTVFINTKPFILLMLLLLSQVFIDYTALFDNLSDNVPSIRYGWELYLNRFSLMDSSSIADYFSKDSFFNLDQNLSIQGIDLIGAPSSGRFPTLFFPRINFDNGYYLNFYSLGILGTAFIFSVFIRLFSLTKPSFLQYYFLSLLLLLHFKEEVFLAGASVYGLIYLSSLDFTLNANSLKTDSSFNPRFQESCHPSHPYTRGLEDMTNASVQRGRQG